MSPEPLRSPAGLEVEYAWVARTQEVMAFRDAGRLRVTSAICPHMGARLVLDRARRSISCPWHGLTFALPDLASGHPRYPRLACFEPPEEG